MFAGSVSYRMRGRSLIQNLRRIVLRSLNACESAAIAERRRWPPRPVKSGTPLKYRVIDFVSPLPTSLGAQTTTATMHQWFSAVMVSVGC